LSRKWGLLPLPRPFGLAGQQQPEERDQPWIGARHQTLLFGEGVFDQSLAAFADLPLALELASGGGGFFLQKGWEKQQREGREPSHAGGFAGCAAQGGVQLGVFGRAEQWLQQARLQLFQLGFGLAPQWHRGQRAEFEARLRLEPGLKQFVSRSIFHVSFKILMPPKIENPRLPGKRGFQNRFSFVSENRIHDAGKPGSVCHSNDQKLAMATHIRLNVRRIIHST
jgi:hypothetical protein